MFTKWEKAMIVVCVVGVLALVAVMGWRGHQSQRWDPHCTCSQQTCFVAPDGGWRQ